MLPPATMPVSWQVDRITSEKVQNFSVAISVSPHVCFILVLILISMFLR